MDVLLYSKFSSASKQLILQLQQTPEILETITVICIDNKLIRAQILADVKIKFKYLPCFIRLNEDTGIFDIYEGKIAFDFFASLQQQVKHVQFKDMQIEPEIHQQPRVAQPVQLSQLSNPSRPVSREKIENVENTENVETRKQTPLTKTAILKQKAQETESQRQLHDLKDFKRKEEFIKNQNTSVKKPNKIATSFQPKKMAFTPIEELDLDSDTLVDINDINDVDENNEKTDDNEDTDERYERDERDENMDEKEEKGKKNGISTYTHIPKNKDTDFSDREIKSKQAETNASKNTGSILSKAMRMQKERGS